MSLQVLRPVTIKARVTENLKSRLTAEIREAMQLLDDEVQQLETQVKRAQLTASINPQQQMQLRQLVEAERGKRQDKKLQLQDDLKAVAGLSLGSEIIQGTAQTINTVEVGTDFDGLELTEILLEDGKVVAIRQGGRR